MKDKIIQGVKFLIFLGLGVFLVWYSINNLTPQQRTDVLDALKRADYGWLIVSIVIGCIAQVSRTIRWQQLIQPMGYRPRFKNTLLAVMISYGANMLFPRLGEVSRCTIVNRYEKVPVQLLLGTVITERILDLVALVLILFLGFLIEVDKIAQFFNDNLASKLEEKLSGFASSWYLAIIAIAALASAIAIFMMLRKVILKLRFYHKVRNAALGLLDGIKSIKDVEKPFVLIFHSIFIWVSYYLMMYICIFCLPETSHLSHGAIITAFVAGALAMIIFPGGLGGYPAFVAAALLLYDLPKEMGLVFGTLVWASQQASIVVGSVTALILLPILNRDNGTPNAEPEVHTG